MAELHPNQIPFQAGRTAKARLVAPEDYLSRPLANIADVAERTAGTIAAIDDTELTEKLNATAAMGLDDISRYEPSDNNYGPAKQKMMANLNSVFSSAPASAQIRFRNQNPMYFENKSLEADKVIFAKRIKYAETKINTLIPQLASNVTTGVTTYKEALNELQNLLKDVSNPFAEAKLFEFNKEITVGNINNLINAGRYQDALDIINNPAQSPELSPSDRTNLNNSVQQTQNAVIKEQEALREKLRKQLKDEGTDVEAELVRQGLRLQERDDDSYATFMSALTDGTDIEYKDKKGNVVFKVNARGLDEIVRRDAAKKLDTYEKDSLAYRRTANSANTRAENLELLLKSQVQGGNRGVSSTITDIDDFVMSKDSRYLSDANYKKLNDYIDAYHLKKTTAVMPSKEFGTETLLYRGTFFDPDKLLPSITGKLFQSEAMSPAGSVALQTLEQMSEGGTLEINGEKISIPKSDIKNAKNTVQKYMKEPATSYNTLMYNFYTNVLSKEQVPNSGSVGDFAYKLWGHTLLLRDTTPALLSSAGIPYNVTEKTLSSANDALISEIEDEGIFDKVLGGKTNQAEANLLREQLAERYYEKIGALPMKELNDSQRQARRSLIKSVAQGNMDGGTATIVDTFSGSGTTDPISPVDKPTIYNKVFGESKWNALTSGSK